MIFLSAFVPSRSVQAAHGVYTSMLTSPLRRCALTQSVLPKDLMIQFKPVRTSINGGSSTIILSPSSILHPRFTAATPGKGAWLICSKDALEMWIRKGSFKRIAPSATLPPYTAQQVQSQLARRLLQETELLVERLKSAPRHLESGDLRPCPIVSYSGYVQYLQDTGARADRPIIVLDFSEDSPQAAPNLGEKSTESISNQAVPLNVAQVVGDIVSPVNEGEPGVSAGRILQRKIRHHLDRIIRIHHRRRPGYSRLKDQLQPSNVYAFVQPEGEGRSTVEAVTHEFTPLLIALHRLRLWQGESIA